MSVTARLHRLSVHLSMGPSWQACEESSCVTRKSPGACHQSHPSWIPIRPAWRSLLHGVQVAHVNPEAGVQRCQAPSVATREAKPRSIVVKGDGRREIGRADGDSDPHDVIVRGPVTNVVTTLLDVAPGR